MNQTPAYIQAALTTDSIRKIGHQIHRTNTRLWILKKAIAKVPPYCLGYKNMDIAEEIIRAKEQVKNLKEAKERLKKETPKALWYPRRKYCGRYNNRENDIKTKIMKDCFRYGFNVKEISAYFNIDLSSVYRRLNLKLYREFDIESKSDVSRKIDSLRVMFNKAKKSPERNKERFDKLKADLEYYRGILRDLILKDNGQPT